MELKEFLETHKDLNARSFGEFMKQRRLELNYNIKNVAECLKVTSGYISDIEKGNRHAPTAFLNKIISILEISEEDKNDFIDLAYLSHETCSPDLIKYLTTSKEAKSARLAVHQVIENDISGDELLKLVTNYIENIKE